MTQRKHPDEIIEGDRVKTPSGDGVLIYHAYTGQCLVLLDIGLKIRTFYGELERA